ncbi:MAG: pitrilysin family protein [Verrucomicrobia bacterium]|nr:pitrilysin family protein [Verrucomicrobiota bacterium]
MKTLSILLALGIAALPLQAATLDRTHPPAAGPLPTATFPDPVTETLSNGLKVFVLPIHKQPMVTFRLLVKSGDVFDGGKPGLAALTAALLNKGTDALTASEFAKKTDFLGISVEAGSGDDALTVTASGLSCYSNEILGFLRDAALRPTFRQEEVDKEKMKMVSNLAQKKMDPEDLSARLRDKLIYGEHPYGAYATPESVQSITRDDLVQFHGHYFQPNNATLVIVGDVEPSAVLAQVKEAFAGLKPAPEAAETKALREFPPVKGVTVHVVDRPGSVQSAILVAARGIAKNNPDAPQLSVVNSVLGGGMSGRLAENLREKHGFTYGASSGFSAKKLGGTFSAEAEVRNAVTGAAVEEILNELKRISSEPIPENELALQRSLLVGNFLMSVENERRLGERLQEIDLYGLPKDFYKTYAKKIAGLKPEKAAELARKYIDPNDLVIVVVGEAKEIVPQLEKFGKVTVYDTDLKEKK